MLINKDELINNVKAPSIYDINITDFISIIEEQPIINQPLWNYINIKPTTYERLLVLCSDGRVKFSRYYKGTFLDIEHSDMIKDKEIKNATKWITLQSLLNTIKEETKWLLIQQI